MSASRERFGTSPRRGITLLELLIVIAIIALLVGMVAPGLGSARAHGRSAGCASNLHTAGTLILGYAAAHEEEVAPVVRERDYFWNRGEQRGWDITTGRWAHSPGGPGSQWQCAESRLPYVGNARALGLDNRATVPHGLLHRVGPRRWCEPARLVLAYDAAEDQETYPLGPDSYGDAALAEQPFIGDVSDEMYGHWPRNEAREYVSFRAYGRGPHRSGTTGALFADGHAVIGGFAAGNEAVFWSGPRWWPDHVED